MKISQTKIVQVDASILRIHCKVSDRFTCSIHDNQGNRLFSQDDGYVPGFMPGDHYGDYIILYIDMDTGMVTNWSPPSPEEIEEFISPKD